MHKTKVKKYKGTSAMPGTGAILRLRKPLLPIPAKPCHLSTHNAIARLFSALSCNSRLHHSSGAYAHQKERKALLQPLHALFRRVCTSIKAVAQAYNGVAPPLFFYNPLNPPRKHSRRSATNKKDLVPWYMVSMAASRNTFLSI